MRARSSASAPAAWARATRSRLEAGMSLYGHEISEEINVLEAGLTRWLKLDKGEFIGRDALLAVQADGGPEAQNRRPRNGRARHRPRRVLRTVTWTAKQIGAGHLRLARAFLQNQHRHGARARGAVAESAQMLLVDVRGNRVRAKQVPLPFYKRPKK